MDSSAADKDWDQRYAEYMQRLIKDEKPTVTLEEVPNSPPPESPRPSSIQASPRTPSSAAKNFSRRVPADRSSRIFRSPSHTRGSYVQVEVDQGKPEMKLWAQQRRFRPLRASLGRLGIIVLIGGSLLVLGVLAFLFFLWMGEGNDGGASAHFIWRRIVLPQLIGPVVTIASAIIRIAVTAQALVCTSLVASLLLERHGVPLVNAAEVSIIRSVNNGPFRLAWLLLSTRSFLRTAKFPTILTLVLLLAAVASQFTSTLLILDLKVSTLIGDERQIPLGTDVTVVGQHVSQDPVVGYSPVFIPFGEISPANTTQLPTGLSDTGVVRRIILPVSEANRTSLRSYRGKAYAFSSRYVCVPPSATTGGFQVLSRVGANDRVSPNNLIPVLSGNLSFQAAFENAGLEFPTGCASGSCFSQSTTFNCSIPFQELNSTDLMSSVCYPSRRNLAYSNARWDMSDEPVANFSQVILAFQTNLSVQQMRGYLGQTNFTKLPDTAKRQGESITWELPEFQFSMSLCFQQLTFDFADVDVSAERDLFAPTAAWDQSDFQYTTDDLATLFGTTTSSPSPPPLNASARGLYTIKSLSNLTKTDLTTLLTPGVLTFGFPTLEAVNIGMLLSPDASGSSSISVNRQNQALYRDTLRRTSRPALALQTLMTTVATMSLLNFVPQMGLTHDTVTVHSVIVLAPRSMRGLLAVTGIVLMTLLATGVVTLLFLAQTRYSSLGDYWRAVAQVYSEETQWVLEEGTEYQDDAIRDMLKAQGELRVKVGRSLGDLGRVQVMASGRQV